MEKKEYRRRGRSMQRCSNFPRHQDIQTINSRRYEIIPEYLWVPLCQLDFLRLGSGAAVDKQRERKYALLSDVSLALAPTTLPIYGWVI
jgi:hypothetical protein